MFTKVMFHVKHIIPIIVILTMVINPISASYITVNDYGLFNKDSNRINVGTQISTTSSTHSARWQLYGLSTDVTYDMWLQLTFDRPISDSEVRFGSTASSYSYFNLDANKLETSYHVSSNYWKKLSNMSGLIEFVNDKSVKIHLYYNSNAGEFNTSMAFAQLFTFSPSSSLTLISQGVACYYDAGGSDYQSILEAINSNVENLPQKIKDILHEQNLIEKQEATTAGEDAIQQGKDALEGILDIASLKDAIMPLITACSYDGIESSWTFPQIKLPAIQGVMSETSLNDEIQINMTEYAEQYIPPVLLTLIRSLLTAGLIVYAIREVITIVNNVIPS